MAASVVLQRAMSKATRLPRIQQKLNTKVYSWGMGALGGLGIGGFQDQELPFPVAALDGEHISAISAGWHGCLVANPDGEAWQWGWKGSTRGFLTAARNRRRRPIIYSWLQWLRLAFRQTLNPQKLAMFAEFKVSHVSTGVEHFAAVTRDGRVFVWGLGFNGQLGHGSKYIDSLVQSPRQVQALEDQKVVQVACGYAHTLFLMHDGDVFACGRAYEGALGIKGLPLEHFEKIKNVAVPISIRHYDTQLDGLHKGIKIVRIAAGMRHSVCLDEHGFLWVCGSNLHGQLGIPLLDGIKFFTKLCDLPPIVDVAAGQFHTIALAADGTVWTWGANLHGQCGRPVKTVTPKSEASNDKLDSPAQESNPTTNDNPQEATPATPLPTTPSITPTTAPPSTPSDPTPPVSNTPDFSPPPRKPRHKSRDEAFEEKVWEGAKAEMPERALLPPLSSKPCRVFAGSLESAVVTQGGECVLFGSGNEVTGCVAPYLALTDVHVLQVAFGHQTSHVLGIPRATQ